MNMHMHGWPIDYEIQHLAIKEDLHQTQLHILTQSDLFLFFLSDLVGVGQYNTTPII